MVKSRPVPTSWKTWLLYSNKLERDSKFQDIRPLAAAPEPHRQFYFHKIDNIMQEIDDRTDLARRLRIDDEWIDINTFVEAVGIPFIYSLINEINDAFHCHPVFSSLSCLDPRNLPEDLEDLIDYGVVRCSFECYFDLIISMNVL